MNTFLELLRDYWWVLPLATHSRGATIRVTWG
jgi:hypothetical protein